MEECFKAYEGFYYVKAGCGVRGCAARSISNVSIRARACEGCACFEFAFRFEHTQQPRRRHELHAIGFGRPAGLWGYEGPVKGGWTDVLPATGEERRPSQCK